MEVTDENFREIIEESKKPAMVQFWAEWCGPCKMMLTVVEEIEKEYSNAIIKRLNVDENPSIADKYGIRSIPTLIFYSGGEIVDKQIGAVSKNVLTETLEPLIESYEKKLEDIELVGLALVNGEIKLVSFIGDGKYKFLDENLNYHNILYGLSLESQAIKEAIEELEFLVNNPKTNEKDLQFFFERHPDFILEDQYKALHSKVVFESEDKEKYIPDFVLEPIGKQPLCDILDIKLPTSKVYVMKKNRPRYSAAVIEAIAQLREYSNILESTANREKVKNEYGLNIYKPKMIVIIGQRGNFDPLVIRRIERGHSNLELKTYDSIIERMKFRTR